jgi:26S proteasome regulatory subunit N3
VTKLLICVQLLMGDLPERSVFRESSLERSLRPYLRITQAVRVGDVVRFGGVVDDVGETFRQVGSTTLVLS